MWGDNQSTFDILFIKKFENWVSPYFFKPLQMIIFLFRLKTERKSCLSNLFTKLFSIKKTANFFIVG